MMGQLVRLPTNPAALDRLTDRQRQANLREQQDDAVRIARAVLRAPERYTPDNVRDACTALRRWGDGFDRLLASQEVSRLQVREQIERNLAKQETPAQIAMQHRDRWPAIIAGGVAFAVVAGIWVWGVMALGGVL
jgi:hypothetical protein